MTTAPTKLRITTDHPGLRPGINDIGTIIDSELKPAQWDRHTLAYIALTLVRRVQHLLMSPYSVPNQDLLNEIATKLDTGKSLTLGGKLERLQRRATRAKRYDGGVDAYQVMRAAIEAAEAALADDLTVVATKLRWTAHFARMAVKAFEDDKAMAAEANEQTRVFRELLGI